MEIKEETFKGFIFITIAQFFGNISNLLIQYLLIILYSPKEYAYFSFAMTFYAFFFIFANFGLGTAIIQFLSSLKDENSGEFVKLISEGFKLVFLFTMIFSLILFFISDLIEQIYKMSGLSILLKYTSIYLFFSNLINYFECTFRGFKIFKNYSISSVTLNFLKLIIVSLNFIVKSPIYFILVQYSIVSFIQFIIILIIQIKSKNLSSFFKFNIKETEKLLTFSVFEFLSLLLSFLSTGFNQFILAYYIDPVELAYYIITLMAIQTLALPMLILGLLFHPYVSYYMQREGVERKNVALIYNLLFKYGLLIMIPLTFYVFFFSEVLIVFFFSFRYYPVSIYIRVVIFYLNLLVIEATGNIFLLASNNQKTIFKLTALNALFCLILSIILIPIYYIYGAILSFIIPRSINIILKGYLAKKKNNINLESYVIFSILKYIISSIISIFFLFIIIFILDINLYNFFFLILFSGIYFGVFFALIILFQAISIVEIKDFLKVLKSSIFIRNKFNVN
ncbi:MAG: oligosaccharide flippase family protein [Promethearchaeota archaeon]